MDPLSIAASVIALVAATQKVAVGLNKLASLRGAPAAVLQLNNELSDLRLILSEAEPLLLKHAQLNLDPKDGGATSPQSEALKLSIERATGRLVDMESVLQNRLLNRMGATDKIGWFMEQDKVRKASKDLRTVRLNISAMLGVVTSTTSFRLETKLQAVQFANEQDRAAVSEALATQKSTFEQAFAYMMAAQRDHDARLERMEASLAANNEKPDASLVDQEISGRRYSDSPGALFQPDSLSALRMRFLRQRRCDVWCDCKCHIHVRTQTPDKLQSIFGTLFIGCRRAADGYLQINYYFPHWFVGRIVSTAMKFQDSVFPKVRMRVLHTRNTFEGIFMSAFDNDADAVEHQLRIGQASVFDATEDSGHSPLHYAVSKSSIEVIKVLFTMGAEPYLENRTQDTPYDVAWSMIHSFQGTPKASVKRIEEMRTLFPTIDSVEERRQFTRVHKIVLQILHLDLEKELLKNPLAIDEVDADGRTPLSWAAARGDSKSVEALLRHGASPDTPNRIGQGPLRQSMNAHDATCTKLLLAYGAKVDQRDHWEQTVLLSSMYYPNPTSFAVPLLKAGAQVNIRDSQGHSPLMEAVSENQADAVKLLLDHGADPDLPNHIGYTALHQGIRRNSYDALAVLLDGKVDIDYTVRDKKKRTVLHWAAEYAELSVLSLLKDRPLHGLNADDQCEKGLTAIDIAQKRRDQETERGPQYNTVLSEWIAAFTDLLEGLMPFKSPKSVLSYTGSATDDEFHDAISELRLGDSTDLAEQGQIPPLQP